MYSEESVKKKEMQWPLILITVLSWSLFPFMAKYFNQPFFTIGFAVCLLLVAVFVVSKSIINRIVLPTQHKIILLCWVGYLLALLLATLKSDSFYSLVQWSILFGKFSFFLFLLYYIKEKTFISSTFSIYSNIAALLVIFALVAACFSAMGISPITYVDLGGKLGEVYFGTYYVRNTSICQPALFFRIQGLCEEPGTFAFALLPALFWFLIAEKAYVRSAIIVLGLTLSFSLGAGVYLLLVLPVIWTIYSVRDKISIFIMIAVSLIALMYVNGSACNKRYLEKLDAHALEEAMMLYGKNVKVGSCYEGEEECRRALRASETTLSGKKASWQARVNGILVVIRYLRSNPMGTGAAVGMRRVNNSISVGYMVAALESGVVGGVSYFSLFSMICWLALKTVWISRNDSYESRIRIVVALSVINVLFMGLQRLQPDLSLWHMWLYAMLFSLSLNTLSGTPLPCKSKRSPIVL